MIKEFTEKNIVACSCGKTLQYNDEDIIKKAYKDRVIYCPFCGEEISVATEEDIITPNNIEYPEDFYHYDSNNYMKDEEIQKQIRKMCIELDATDKEVDYLVYAVGSTLIIAQRFADNIQVFVAHNYYEVDFDIDIEDDE